MLLFFHLSQYIKIKGRWLLNDLMVNYFHNIEILPSGNSTLRGVVSLLFFLHKIELKLKLIVVFVFVFFTTAVFRTM